MTKFERDLDRDAAADMLVNDAGIASRREVQHILNEANSKGFVILPNLEVSCNTIGLFAIRIK